MSKWMLLDSETLLNNRWLTLLKNSYQMAKGVVLYDYYVIQRADFVVVVALVRDSVIRIRQYRPATDRSYWCLPAGHIEDRESPEAAAIRELCEETGYRGYDSRLIGRLDPLPGYIRSRAHVVVCRAEPASRTRDHESDELIECPWNEALQLIASGDIDEMQAVSALLLANLNNVPLQSDREIRGAPVLK